MINRYILHALLLSHVLGDFYIQSKKHSERMTKSYFHVVFHNIRYFIIYSVCCVLLNDRNIAVATVYLSLLHLIFDSIFFCYRKRRETEHKRFYIVQILNILCIVMASYVLTLTRRVYIFSDLSSILSIVDLLPETLKLILPVLILIKPTNVLIKYTLASYKAEIEPEEGLANAGAYIGILERLIMLLLIASEQFSAIGLVLTAKSIARYKKISEDKQFAEYYLLGTLLSTLSVVLVHLLLT